MSTQELKSLNLKAINLPKFGLLGTAALLVTIYLSLLWKIDDSSHLGISVLFFLGIGTLIQERYNRLNLSSNIISVFVGIVLILSMLILSVFVSQQDVTIQGGGGLTSSERLIFISLRIMPLVSGVGLSFLATSFFKAQAFRQFWRELLLLFFLGVPSIIADLMFDISPITAYASAFILHYSSFDVGLQGVNIYLPAGDGTDNLRAVQVYYECSGIETMAYLLSLSALFLIKYPLSRWSYRLIVPLIALMLGFFVNVVRVAIMAVVVDQKELFTYLHEGDASLLFGMVAVIIFGLIYWQMLPSPSSSKGVKKSLKKSYPLSDIWD